MADLDIQITEHLTRLKMWYEGMPIRGSGDSNETPLQTTTAEMVSNQQIPQGFVFAWKRPSGLGWCRALLTWLTGGPPSVVPDIGTICIGVRTVHQHFFRGVTDAEAHANALLAVLETFGVKPTFDVL